MRRKINLNCPWLLAEGKSAKLIRWLVAEHDHVEMDQDIMVVLLEDGEFVAPSPVDGTFETIMAEPGDMIDPDQVLAIILTD